eukprot:m.130898 g.130898  ORF g.130898 m.130898 type:complete len:85 (-) comp52359_c0_seq27:494-748(-)
MLARTPALVSARCALDLQVQAIGSSLSLSPCTSKAIFNNAHLQATCDTVSAPDRKLLLFLSGASPLLSCRKWRRRPSAVAMPAV